MSHNPKAIRIAAIAALLLCFSSAVSMAMPTAAASPIDARAGTAERTVVRTVHYADLNLETDRGRVELNRRLDRAVSSICAIDPVVSSAAVLDEQARCIADTGAGLDAQIAAAVRANRVRVARVASN